MLELKAISSRIKSTDFKRIARAALHHSEQLVPQWLPDGDAGGDLISFYAYLHGLGQSEAAIRVAREIGYD